MNKVYKRPAFIDIENSSDSKIAFWKTKPDYVQNRR